MLIKQAPQIWDGLRSIICVYKPANVSAHQVRRTIISAICSELNEMECRPPVDYVTIEGDTSKHLTVSVTPSLADHPLVVGPRYQLTDLTCSWSNYLGFNTSGVLVLGLRDGTKKAKYIRENRPTRCYRVSGRLGQATENGFEDGKVVERSTWRHVRLAHMNKFLAHMQASHQKEMFKRCGIDLQSQAAYELACKGPLRPADSKIPVLYSLKCVKFEPPDFVLEIQGVNEYETYLKGLVHELGLKLHSTAHCTGIQCIRHSYFTIEDSLLRKHWKLQHIITNMENCMRIMESHENILHQKSAVLQ